MWSPVVRFGDLLHLMVGGRGRWTYPVSMRLAMAQISSGTDPAENLELVVSATERAAADGADLVVFPEATMCRFGVKLGPIAEPLDGPWADAVAGIAAQCGVSVVAGMFTPALSPVASLAPALSPVASLAPELSPRERVRNTLLVVTPDGRRAGYDKIHLYDAFGFAESRTVEAGSEPVIVTVADCRVGLATCYDIRFPRLFTALARAGADLIVVPTSWGAGPGKLRQWQTLATARALDATAFVAAVGQAEPSDPAVAESGAPTGIGHSQITDPFGSVVVAYDSEPRIEVHTVDPTVVGKARTALAVLENERDIAEPRLML